MTKVYNAQFNKKNVKEKLGFEFKKMPMVFFGLLFKINIKIIKITKLKKEKEGEFSMNNPIVFIITMLILQYLLK